MRVAATLESTLARTLHATIDLAKAKTEVLLQRGFPSASSLTQLLVAQQIFSAAIIDARGIIEDNLLESLNRLADLSCQLADNFDLREASLRSNISIPPQSSPLPPPDPPPVTQGPLPPSSDSAIQFEQSTALVLSNTSDELTAHFQVIYIADLPVICARYHPEWPEFKLAPSRAQQYQLMANQLANYKNKTATPLELPDHVWSECPARAGFSVHVDGTSWGAAGFATNKTKFMQALTFALVILAELLRLPVVGKVDKSEVLDGVLRDIRWYFGMSDETSDETTDEASEKLQLKNIDSGTDASAHIPEPKLIVTVSDLCLREATKWLNEYHIKHAYTNSMHEEWVPAIILRFTHSGISLKFKEGFSGRPPGRVFDFAEELFMAGPKYYKTVKLRALTVVRESDSLFWSLSNRRLAALRMVQALSAETIWVKCNIYRHHPAFSETRALTTENEGVGVRPNNVVREYEYAQELAAYGTFNAHAAVVEWA